jgi:Holliday junction resolvasome RuvABC endonuclease subunit
MTSFRYLLAIDPSLTCSGWALFSVPQGSITAVGKVKSDPPSVPMGERLRTLQDRISALLAKLGVGSEDILVCEAATTVKDPHNALKVESVRSIFESLARGRGANVPGRVNPRSVHHEVIGLKGQQLPRAQVKALAVRTAELLYSADLVRLGLAGSQLSRHQDIVDALLVGRLALTRVQSALDGEIPLEAQFQVAKPQRRSSWRVRASGV